LKGEAKVEWNRPPLEARRSVAPDSFMLESSDIERLVEEQLTALASQPDLVDALRSYRIQGGDEAAQPWHVAGFYAYEGKNKRLVFEALYLKLLDTCVVRVFRENRLNILYARKAVGDTGKLSAKVCEAAELFLMHLQKPLAAHIFERDYGGISDVLGHSMLPALLPIPPPVSLEDIED
jgi:hypothetical protein